MLNVLNKTAICSVFRHRLSHDELQNTFVLSSLRQFVICHLSRCKDSILPIMLKVNVYRDTHKKKLEYSEHGTINDFSCYWRCQAITSII